MASAGHRPAYTNSSKKLRSRPAAEPMGNDMDMPKAGHGGRTETGYRGVLHKLGGIEHDGKRAIVDQ